MLERYFKKPCTLYRLRSGPAGPFLDGFAESLCAVGYDVNTTALYAKGDARPARGLALARPRQHADH